MNYKTYWSILDTPSHTIKSNIVFLIISICFGLLWFLAKKNQKNNSSGDKLIVLWGTGTFSLLGLVGYCVLTFVYKDITDIQTLKMLNSNNTPKVEGVVSNFHRSHRNAKWGGETIENFTVDSVQFAYGDALFGRFNSFCKTNNNVIFNGLKVRVTYMKTSNYGENFNSILRIEVAD